MGIGVRCQINWQWRDDGVLEGGKGDNSTPFPAGNLAPSSPADEMVKMYVLSDPVGPYGQISFILSCPPPWKNLPHPYPLTENGSGYRLHYPIHDAAAMRLYFSREPTTLLLTYSFRRCESFCVVSREKHQWRTWALGWWGTWSPGHSVCELLT